MLLRKTIETLPFVRGSKFEETKTKLLVRNSNRTVLQENLEKYFNSKRIIFKRRKKPTEIEVKGSDQVLIFKPLKAKGVGGLKFEDQLKNDLNEWFAGAELNELKHKDTIELLVKTIKLKQDSGYKAEKVGTANTKRPPSIAGGRLTVTNNGKGNVSDLNILGRNKQVLYYMSLKFSPSFYIYNATVIDYFKNTNPNVRKMINEFFGFDGLRMAQAFGKEYSANTVKPNYAAVTRRLVDVIKQALGPDIVLVTKIKDGLNYINDIKGFGHKISASGLNTNSYGYAEKGVRKYNFIKFDANINGHPYEVNFQFRGTTATDTGPRYLRINLKAK
jgi:hypothetical protein